MSSSRSIAAARARRAGDNVPPVSGNRPITSIGSQAAFANQMPQQPSNARVSRGPMTSQNQYKQPPQYQQPPQQQQGLPFNKLSISDAIGLVTLRLGRVEQFMIDIENGEHNISGKSSIPENSKIIDNSVLTSIINRLDSLEKREIGNTNSDSSISSEELTKLNEEIKNLKESVTQLNDGVVKQSLTIAKHNEQMFRIERDTVETKDMLKTLMLKFDMFVNETNTRFSDYEFAISEIEKNLPVSNGETDVNENIVEDEIKGADSITESNNIMSIDLKNIIKQELANEAN